MSKESKGKKVALELQLDEMRCARCGRWLGYEYIIEGLILLKCPKCGNVNLFFGGNDDVDSAIELLASLFAQAKILPEPDNAPKPHKE